MIATPKMEIKQERPDASQRQRHHVAQDHDDIQERAEGQVKQNKDQPQGQRDDVQEPSFGLLHLLKLAAPFRPVRGPEELARFPLGLGYRAGQVAAADAEFDRD